MVGALSSFLVIASDPRRLRSSSKEIPKPSMEDEVVAGLAMESSSSSAAAAAAVEGVGMRYEDDEDEGDVCRICRNPGDAENPLRYPCACSGSIKYVHQECLLQWLNHSNARQCEVTKP